MNAEPRNAAWCLPVQRDFLAFVVVLIVVLVVLVFPVLDRLHGQGPIEADLEELGVVRAEVAPARARVVVVVDYEERRRIENEHTLDGDEREGERRAAVAVQIMRVGDVDLLEGSTAAGLGGAIALDHEELVVVDGGHVADVGAGRLELVQPVPAGMLSPFRVELVDAQVLTGVNET